MAQLHTTPVQSVPAQQDRLDELALGEENTDERKESYTFWETQPVAQFKDDAAALQAAEVPPFGALALMGRAPAVPLSCRLRAHACCMPAGGPHRCAQNTC